METFDSTRHLLAWARLVEDKVRALVAHRRATDPAPDDPFRGLYLSDEVVDALLRRTTSPVLDTSQRRTDLDARAAEAESTGPALRLRSLARAAGLSDDDVEILVICLLPDLDSRFEKLYGYLNDDVTHRRATVGLALELSGLSPLDATARARLTPGGPLVEHSLIVVDDVDRPFLTRTLRVPDRVAAHLLGSDHPDPALGDVLVEPMGHRGPQAHRLATAFVHGERLCYVRESVGDAGVAMAIAALQLAGHNVMSCDATRLNACADVLGVVSVLGREALLRGASLVISPVEAFGPRSAELIYRLTRLPVPVVLTGTTTWDPDWSDHVPLTVESARLTLSERADLWRNELGDTAIELDVEDIAGQYVFGPRQVAAAITAAEALARSQGNGDGPDDDALRRGARSQNAAGLERLARRIAPGVGWDDIVLPDKALRQLHELTSRARNRERVLTDWRMRPGGGRGTGITALFAGDSGTGKTMAAEVIAGDLGLDLYTVNLATVVDKYVGETEKNLERIFTEASRVSAVLLFDEADAIFGKRSEVRDAHDRYANIESAYLLQRMETFDGLAVLATNLRANLDEAFTRRLDMIVDFPVPDDDARLALWRRCLAPPVPVVDGLDLAGYAQAFTLSGGNIRSAAITAAYLAAEGATAVDATHLTAAIQQEFRKLGRLLPSNHADVTGRVRATPA